MRLSSSDPDLILNLASSISHPQSLVLNLSLTPFPPSPVAQHYEEIRAKEEERRRKERNREREAAGDFGGGEVEGDMLKLEGKKKSKGRSSGGGVAEKVVGKEEEEEPEEFEYEEEGVAPMPKAGAVDDFRWAETMVRYMHARARIKEEKNALPQSVEQQGMH